MIYLDLIIDKIEYYPAIMAVLGKIELSTGQKTVKKVKIARYW